MSESNIKTGAASIIKHPSLSGISGGYPNTKESFFARVSFVLYDDYDISKFNLYGGYEAIGTIECQPIINNLVSSGPVVVARPINSNIRKFPVENEIVQVFPASSNQAQTPKGNYISQYYYGDIVGAWDSPEHNAVPDQDYFDQDTTSATGDRFIESGDINKLFQAPGDMTIEGRKGSSIRLGSSNSTMNTPWPGYNGSPVLLLSNNHYNSSGSNWIPVFEDINKDGSSIYLCSSQSIAIAVSNNNFDSYNETINTSPAPNYVQPVIPQSNMTSSLKSADNSVSQSFTPAASYSVTSSFNSTSSINDEVNYMPDNANQVYYKEFSDTVIAGTDFPANKQPSIFTITPKISNSGGNFKVDVNEIQTGINAGNYKNIPIISCAQTKISNASFVNIIKSLNLSLNISRAVLGVAINEQGYDPITGYNYNHYGVQTDGGKWPLGPHNIQFIGQFVITNGTIITRPLAAFRSEQDGILFMADQLTRKGFASLSTSLAMANLYTTSWYGNPVSTSFVSQKKSVFDIAFKLIS